MKHASTELVKLLVLFLLLLEAGALGYIYHELDIEVDRNYAVGLQILAECKR